MSDLQLIGFGVACVIVLGCVYEILRMKFASAAATGIWANTACASGVALVLVGLLFPVVGITTGQVMNVFGDSTLVISAGLVACTAAFALGSAVTRKLLCLPAGHTA
jgi:hypothetical protein